MGTADFYLNVYLDKMYENKLEYVTTKLKLHKIFLFKITEKNSTFEMSIYCFFDNFLPTTVIIYNIINSINTGQICIETNGIKCDFVFKTDYEFLNFIFNAQKNRLYSYYELIGYLGMDAINYYKISKNKKYRKLYHEFNNH